MGVCTIEQEPIYDDMPVGQEIVYTISNDSTVANKTRVKFGAIVRISTSAINTATTNQIIGTFKTTPNNRGVGIFDFRSIFENYVSADNMADKGAGFKGTATANAYTYPIHIIDKYSLNNNTFRNAQIRFFTEYLDDDPASSTYNTIIREAGSSRDGDALKIWNGYVKHTDLINMFGKDFGYATNLFPPNDSSRRYLTNAPTTQYANIDDYGTIAWTQPSDTAQNKAHQLIITYFADNVNLGSNTIVTNSANGAGSAWSTYSHNYMCFAGVFPANLNNWSANFAAAVTNGLTHYRVSMTDNTGATGTLQSLLIYINCPEVKGYEPIRLCWLNQWGAWDYFTFTKKSSRKYSTKPTTYTQLKGTWNKDFYRLGATGHQGGKKSFRINTTEKIKIATDFVSEDFNVMFEELINSPEVYMLKGYNGLSTAFASYIDYVTPVTLTTKGFTRKTLANDNMINYDFEIQKTQTLRTQTI